MTAELSARLRLAGDEVPDLVALPSRRAYLEAGAGHVLTASRIVVHGDEATAWNHSAVLVRRGEVWAADRLSANRWSLVRTQNGWRVRERVSRLLDGSVDARGVFSAGTA